MVPSKQLPSARVDLLINTHTSIEDVDKIFQSHKLKWKLGHFKHIGTYTKNKGFIVIYNNNLLKVKDLKVILVGQLVSFLVKVNNDWINFTTMYAPPDDNNPNFMLNGKQALDNMEGDLGLICGDYSSTLDAEYNRFGYKSDTHRKCRCNINNWLETGELLDAVRCFHPETPHYSWRTQFFVI